MSKVVNLFTLSTYMLFSHVFMQQLARTIIEIDSVIGRPFDSIMSIVSPNSYSLALLVSQIRILIDGVIYLEVTGTERMVFCIRFELSSLIALFLGAIVESNKFVER